jgi:hypothetical protein
MTGRTAWRALLDEPLRLAQVAAVSPSGVPLLGSQWFVFESDRFWFTSQQGSPLVTAASAGKEVAVIVDEFRPPQILQIRVRGAGSVHEHDRERLVRIYQRYLDGSIDEWPLSFPERLDDPTWLLWSVPPTSGLAVDSSGFTDQESSRWRSLAECPLLD